MKATGESMYKTVKKMVKKSWIFQKITKNLVNGQQKTKLSQNGKKTPKIVIVKATEESITFQSMYKTVKKCQNGLDFPKNHQKSPTKRQNLAKMTKETPKLFSGSNRGIDHIPINVS